jgi:hypothetical protein
MLAFIHSRHEPRLAVKVAPCWITPPIRGAAVETGDLESGLGVSAAWALVVTSTHKATTVRTARIDLKVFTTPYFSTFETPHPVFLL